MSHDSQSSSSNAPANTIEEVVVKADGSTSTKFYTKSKFLGKGGFARVYEIISQSTKRSYAGKVIPKSTLTRSRAKQKLMSEIKIHRSLKHIGVVGFEHFFEDSNDVFIMLELCENQTMSELLRRRKRLLELEVQCYLLQVISALQYIHGKNVIHRDLKIGNLFLTDQMQVKIGDFGLASKLEFEGQKRNTICGTPNYIAPEVLDGKAGHSFQADIWSLGVIMYTLLVGKPPFETKDVKKTYNLIKMNTYTIPDHLGLSPQAVGLITRILKTDPEKRPSLSEILDHDFFKMGNGIPKLLPPSTLAIPPSANYVAQFLPRSQDLVIVPSAETLNFKKLKPSSSTRNLLMTDRPRQTRYSEKKLSIRPTDRHGILVTKWVDYSKKYGLGYLLTDGATGVYFNDNTKMVLSSNIIAYIQNDDETKFSVDDYPQNLHKKVNILVHFKNYLQVERENTGSPENITYVKKWTKTKKAILFRLSNKDTQVIFADKTEVILSGKHVSFVAKNREKTTLLLEEAMSAYNPEISKRLKYTRDLINTMLSEKSS